MSDLTLEIILRRGDTILHRQIVDALQSTKYIFIAGSYITVLPSRQRLRSVTITPDVKEENE